MQTGYLAVEPSNPWTVNGNLIDQDEDLERELGKAWDDRATINLNQDIHFDSTVMLYYFPCRKTSAQVARAAGAGALGPSCHYSNLWPSS
ncbi:hypothetical protein LshimejAT787_1602450 [Lyophyllum shimeji]|uniref:Uncharacterized protein n=1 Tax=Lyophyllum shimeji TaxID=47721 RepID=A0A9P3PYG0_LYOSH|nr:hypothetical protein LshimejAT787_1602450 [Lyophyllum shimeji]